ncbi:DNA-binding protein [Megasphaera cerevisiae DSM 20462]|jgi:transcriptional regulator with XRE-family HTH domain|uniref:DNA-binding protein n=1 Tax=Megasphaera cerevisiae DSM 20462 TaxID=1122219 RepID=A0A0J6ZRZ5_9FIRM|nr:XRE family transcriptional regulator [Megasphaera cerevisiae]KMO87726.1 DNA-binding protein [Megasphaera cerevisiae DSM 20462]OKY53348.1 DNA-binding protein [Megasphaera cerevisiae]SJZ64292.1 transcriptional regulator, XRE family with cupin sensor [Megasphaera cerevisiae DSM 20462]
MDLGKIIAMNLKRLRTDRNLTQGQLSKISGISKAMLSEIEKGNSNPTINTLWKIAKGLNVTYTQLMAEIETDMTVVRREKTVRQSGEMGHYRIYCYFKSTPVRNFELFYAELDGGTSNASIGHSEKSQEYVYIIEGELLLRTDAGAYLLRQGDALTFDSTIRHTYINDANTCLKFMIVNYYPARI